MCQNLLILSHLLESFDVPEWRVRLDHGQGQQARFAEVPVQWGPVWTSLNMSEAGGGSCTLKSIYHCIYKDGPDIYRFLKVQVMWTIKQFYEGEIPTKSVIISVILILLKNSNIVCVILDYFKIFFCNISFVKYFFFISFKYSKILFSRWSPLYFNVRIFV